LQIEEMLSFLITPWQVFPLKQKLRLPVTIEHIDILKNVKVPKPV
jgi:hypothetical protein